MSWDKKISIVVSSCDGFQDCWEPFIQSLKNSGGGFLYNTYIISNFKISAIVNEKIRFLPIGKDLKWSTNLKTALERVPTDYIIYLQEDYFLNKPINWAHLNSHIEYCIDNNIDYLRLTFPYLPGRVCDKYYVENSLDQAYAICLQAGLWKKEVLAKLCIDGWSGWDFEQKVAGRIQMFMPNFKFLGLTRSAKGQISYVKGTAVRKGLWTNAGYHFLRKNGYKHLLKQRKKEPLYWMLVDIDGLLRPLAKCIWLCLKKFHSQ